MLTPVGLIMLLAYFFNQNLSQVEMINQGYNLIGLLLLSYLERFYFIFLSEGCASNNLRFTTVSVPI